MPYSPLIEALGVGVLSLLDASLYKEAQTGNIKRASLSEVVLIYHCNLFSSSLLLFTLFSPYKQCLDKLLFAESLIASMFLHPVGNSQAPFYLIFYLTFDMAMHPLIKTLSSLGFQNFMLS